MNDIYVEVFKDLTDKEKSCCSMIESILAYDKWWEYSSHLDNEYLDSYRESLGEDRVKELFETLSDYISNNYDLIINTYTDSEGCIYNGFEKKEWKNRLDDVSFSDAENGCIEENRYAIYQMKKEFIHDYGFESLDYLSKTDFKLNSENYNLVYFDNYIKSENKPIGAFLEELFSKFNINRPKDFRGHSMSMGDVIIINDGNELSAHYCDTVGFKKIDNFINNKEKVKTR